MDNQQLEIGLLREKITIEMNKKKQDKYTKYIIEKVMSDDNIDRLKSVLETIRYAERKMRQVDRMTQNEYCKYQKQVINRDVRELKSKGYNIDGWEEEKREYDKRAKI